MIKKINICFVTTTYVTFKSFLKPLSKYLYETGHYDISFICNESSEIKDDIPDFINYYPVTMKRGIDPSGIKAIRQMQKIFKTHKFDIVQYSTPNASFYASIAAKKAKIKCRLYCQWGIRYVGMIGIKKNVFKFLEKLVCKNSTWIEPDSFGNLEFSISENLYNKSKSSVIWCGSASGVDLNKFDISKKSILRAKTREKLNLSDNNILICFVGRASVEKGINELFEAMYNLEKIYSNIKLILVGSQEFDSAVNAKLLKWSQVSDNVIYCGQSETVEIFLAASDIFVLPSYREGFGSVVVEAQAMGVPVVVTEIPGPLDAMLPNITGLTAKKANAQTLQSAIEILINDSCLRERLGQEGRRFVEEKFEQNKLFSFIDEDRKRLYYEFSK